MCSPPAVEFAKFAGRSRLINLLLATSSAAAAVGTHYAEERGSLWLVAAAGVGIAIPYNLLLMSPPTPVAPVPPQALPPAYAYGRVPTPPAVPRAAGGLGPEGEGLHLEEGDPHVTFAEDDASSLASDHLAHARLASAKSGKSLHGGQGRRGACPVLLRPLAPAPPGPGRGCARLCPLLLRRDVPCASLHINLPETVLL